MSDLLGKSVLLVGLDPDLQDTVVETLAEFEVIISNSATDVLVSIILACSGPLPVV